MQLRLHNEDVLLKLYFQDAQMSVGEGQRDLFAFADHVHLNVQ